MHEGLVSGVVKLLRWGCPRLMALCSSVHRGLYGMCFDLSYTERTLQGSAHDFAAGGVYMIYEARVPVMYSSAGLRLWVEGD